MDEKKEFVIAEVMPGKLNALVKNIMRQTGANDPNEAIRLVNSGEWVISISPIKPKWFEERDVIYFSVTSDGTTGEQWVVRLKNKGHRVGDYAKSVLRSKDFKPTIGVTYEIAVLKGTLFNDDDRIAGKIRQEAKTFKGSMPNAEVACLIREKFSDKELEAMGLYRIVAMHEPIKDSDGDLRLLSAGREGGHCLRTWRGGSSDDFTRDDGFAFVVLQGLARKV